MTIDLEAIEARANAATPGPWCADCGNVATAYQGAASDFMIVVAHDHGASACANAEFIASARQDIPALIAEVRRLRELTSVSMGVGAGRSDNCLVVHGDYESIRAAQTIVFEMERLRATVERVKALLPKWQAALRQAVREGVPGNKIDAYDFAEAATRAFSRDLETALRGDGP